MLLQDYDYECPSGCSPFIKCVFCEKALVCSSEEILGAKLLPCFHTVCQSCIAPSSWPNDVSKTCPLCNVLLSKDLLENKILQEIVAEPQPDSLQKGMCAGHENVPAIRWCKECSGFVCRICIEAHENLIKIRNHQMVDVKEAPLSSTESSLVRFACNDHPNRVLEVYCEQCEQMTCRDCQLEKHKQHNYQFINELTVNLKKSLMLKFGEIKMAEEIVKVSQKTAEKTKGELRAHHEQLSKELEDYVNKVKETIDARYQELKTQLDTLINDEIKAYEKSIVQNDGLISPIKHSLNVLHVILSISSDPAIIYSQKHLDKCLKLLLFEKKRNIVNPDVKKTFKFNYDNQSGRELMQMIKSMGSFTAESTLPEGACLEVSVPIIEAHKQSIPAGTTLHRSPAKISLKTVPTGSLQSTEPTQERRSVDSSSNPTEVNNVLAPLWHVPVGQRPLAQCAHRKVARRDSKEHNLRKLLADANQLERANRAVEQQGQTTQSPLNQLIGTCQSYDNAIMPVLPPYPVAPTSQATTLSPDINMRYAVAHNSNVNQQMLVPLPHNQTQNTDHQANQMVVHQQQQRLPTRTPSGAPPPYGQAYPKNNGRVMWSAYQQQLMAQQMQHIQRPQLPQLNNQKHDYYPGSTHNPYNHMT